jgi:hypothetical protein
MRPLLDIKIAIESEKIKPKRTKSVSGKVFESSQLDTDLPDIISSMDIDNMINVTEIIKA